jgi:hypothetical protein
MDEADRDRLVTELVENPQEREPILREAHLSEQEREEILALVDTADLLWLSAQQPPPLEDDPAAKMLGWKEPPS